MNIALAVLIVLFASFVRAVSGFGQALIVAPLFTFVMEPKQAVILSMLIGAISSLFVLFHIWRNVDVKRSVFLGLGSIFGIPVGVYLLSTLSPTLLQLTMASIAIPSAILLISGHSHRFSRDSTGCVIAGFLGGALVAATSMGGPPIVLFLLNQGLVKEKFVATCGLLFLFMSLASFSAHSVLGLVGTETLIQAAILVPALWLGTYIGIKVLSKIQPMLFLKIASGVVVLSAIAIMVNIAMKTWS